MKKSKINKRKHKIVIVLAALATAALTLLSSCGTNAGDSTVPEEGVVTERVAQTQATPKTDTLADPAENQTVTTEDFSITGKDGTAVNPSEDGIYTVAASGDYTVKGLIDGGRIVVNVPDTKADGETVRLILSDTSITCAAGAPICVLSAAKVDIEAAEGTYNVVTDARTESSSSTASSSSAALTDASSAGSTSASDDDSLNESAAIIAACDLKISGKGTLVVNGEFDNGIKSKDDLTVKNVTLKVTAVGCALKGNDSVTVESGSLILISTGGDCVKTSGTDVSSKGNQRGNITISGGQVDIYAAQDGISAAYDAIVSEGATLNIFTASYSDYGSSSSASTEKYLIVPKSAYSTSNDYYAYFYVSNPDFDASDGGKWVKCTYETMVYSGRTSYYGLVYKAPSGYSGVRYCIMRSGSAPSGEVVTASTSGEPVNTSMNAYLITSVSSGSIDGDWASLSSGSGNSNKTTFSSKGIKAYNEVLISGGTVNISCGDDGIHANSGTALDNGSKGKGNIVISGGTLTVTASDDGMHADNALTISGGSVNIVKSHEGLEGNVVNIAGGSTFIYADDDGVNACKGSSTPLVNITGGYLDVTTPSGDTDGIDSNGNITMSGGFVLVKGGSTMGSMSGSIDVDGSIKVTGGTVVALGGICETPSSGSVNTYVSSGTSFQAGNYSLKDSSGGEILSFSLSGNYSSVWIASDGLSLNGQYVLSRDGTTVLEWTQSSSTTGSVGGGGWGGGGWGPGGGGPGGHGRP